MHYHYICFHQIACNVFYFDLNIIATDIQFVKKSYQQNTRRNLKNASNFH